jgi:hypothetical protein
MTPRKLALVLFAAVVGLTALVASPAAAESRGTGKVRTTRFTVTLTSQQTVLHQAGTDGEVTYGWNQLTGTATSDSGDVHVEMLGNVQYVDGQGPIFGSVTLTFASQSVVGFRMKGDAAKDSSGTTNFTGTLKVLGGTAALNQAKGGGRFTGSRSAALGSPVVLEFTIKLRGLDIG